jgi:hypothetical protein
MSKLCSLAAIVLSAAMPFSAFSQQIQPGAGNGKAIALAQKSPEVQSAYNFLIEQARHLKNGKLRNQTLDALSNPRTCVTHRAGVDAAKKDALLQQLTSAGLINPADGAAFPGGALAGVFPPVLDEGSKSLVCHRHFSRLPAAFMAGTILILAVCRCMSRTTISPTRIWLSSIVRCMAIHSLDCR